LGFAALGLVESIAYFGIGLAAFWVLRQLGLVESIAYFGIGPAAFWGLRHWVFCRPSPILESVLRHFGVCGIGFFVVHRLFWNRSCGILGFAALGQTSSSAYFGIGPAA
jgi:hypothetical protein